MPLLSGFSGFGTLVSRCPLRETVSTVIVGGLEMLRKSMVAATLMLASVMFASLSLMLVHGQVQAAPAEQLVALAEKAAQQVQNLIDIVKANDTALEKVGEVGLTSNLEGNVSLYENDGLGYLAMAKDALARRDYEAAVDYALDALKVFREVYSSIHVILEAAGLQKGHLIENQGLLEAITRELQRIERLKEILPESVPQEILDKLETAKELLIEAKTILLEGDADTARSLFLEARSKITEVYNYLKAEAEASNAWRLRSYCERLQMRIQERFQYCHRNGIDVTGVLQSFGYQNEAQYTETLQNRIQMAISEQNFGEAIQICQEVSQMVQQMEQALNQEINRHQGGYGSGGSGGSGYGGGSSFGAGYGGKGGS
ncbi:MAG: hypothetical protein ACPLKQ_08810 [Candidatus Bathyarchaeales archaeon]